MPNTRVNPAQSPIQISVHYSAIFYAATPDFGNQSSGACGLCLEHRGFLPVVHGELAPEAIGAQECLSISLADCACWLRLENLPDAIGAEECLRIAIGALECLRLAIGSLECLRIARLRIAIGALEWCPFQAHQTAHTKHQSVCVYVYVCMCICVCVCVYVWAHHLCREPTKTPTQSRQPFVQF